MPNISNSNKILEASVIIDNNKIQIKFGKKTMILEQLGKDIVIHNKHGFIAMKKEYFIQFPECASPYDYMRENLYEVSCIK